jgi:hypothetical protein
MIFIAASCPCQLLVVPIRDEGFSDGGAVSVAGQLSSCLLRFRYLSMELTAESHEFESPVMELCTHRCGTTVSDAIISVFWQWLTCNSTKYICN